MKDKKENRIKTTVIVTTLILALISTMSVMAASAQTTGDININEIMYNPPGADTNHEWIELYNNDTTDINITVID
jgi:ABC-type glycerol-3-phosphate transport system substrate-binding protein